MSILWYLCPLTGSCSVDVLTSCPWLFVYCSRLFSRWIIRLTSSSNLLKKRSSCPTPNAKLAVLESWKVIWLMFYTFFLSYKQNIKKLVLSLIRPSIVHSPVQSIKYKVNREWSLLTSFSCFLLKFSAKRKHNAVTSYKKIYAM